VVVDVRLVTEVSFFEHEKRKEQKQIATAIFFILKKSLKRIDFIVGQDKEHEKLGNYCSSVGKFLTN